MASIQVSQYRSNETEIVGETSVSRVNPTIQAGNAAIVAALIGKPNAIANNNNSSTTDFMNQFPADGLAASRSPVLRKQQHHAKRTNDNEAYLQNLDSDSDCDCDVNEMTAREGDSSGIESSG